MSPKTLLHFPVSEAALAEMDAQRLNNRNNSDVETRCLALAKQMLGEELFKAGLCYGNEDTGVFYIAFGDELELAFLSGPAPEDDYFLVSFLGATSPIPARTLAGIGAAIEHAKKLMHESCMDIESYLENSLLIDEE